MNEDENLYDKLTEMFGSFPENISILEETINIDTQLEYFENSRLIKEDFNEEDAMSGADLLFDPALSSLEIKSILSRIACVEKVEAYRLIERYMRNPRPEVREWGILAMQESRMLIESELLDENHIFISTGLGGKGNKLRYFVALLSRYEKDFTATQKRIIKSEFEHLLKKSGGEIEKIRFSGNLASLLTIIPISINIKQALDSAIAECNQFGDFLQEDFIVTNVKTLEFDEIRSFLNKDTDIT
jgi:hypothetical protein